MLYRVVKKRPLCYTAYSMSGGKVSILTVRTACLIDETIKDPNARTVTVKNLKKGKTYYFRTCTYTEVKNRVSGEDKWRQGDLPLFLCVDYRSADKVYLRYGILEASVRGLLWTRYIRN